MSSVAEEFFSTLLFGVDEEFQYFLGEDLAGFTMTGHHSSFSSSLIPYLMLMGDENDALTVAQEATSEIVSSKRQPTTILEPIVKKVEDVGIEESGIMCPICMEEISKGSVGKRLQCSHKYHGKCIVEWLKKSKTCPTCRHEID